MVILKSSCLEAHILEFGATLSGLWTASHPQSLVLGSPDVTAYATALTYCGAVVGPVANRIGGGTVMVAGTRWQMDANEGTTALHSGPRGLHARVWRVIRQSHDDVVLQCDLPDGACGLPGQRRFEARYSLMDTGELHLELTATSDRDTLVNLAHHPYWRLGSGPSVGDHTLRIMADHYLPVTENTLPTGETAQVKGTPYDFRNSPLVPIDQTLDANLCLSNARTESPECAALLTGPDGLTLQIDTTEPGLQIYNGTGLASPGLSSAQVRLHAGQILSPCAGIALEPQSWPDAPNHKGFPSIMLRAGEIYRQHTAYRIS